MNSKSRKHKVFIGHGRSELWRQLKDFLEDTLGHYYVEFNSETPEGTSTKERLEAMMNSSEFAFLVMTAEDEHKDGKRHARSNVIHETGLFQAHLGFQRAIILKEDGCEEFSNIHGLTTIRFPKGDISAAFEKVRKVLSSFAKRQNSQIQLKSTQELAHAYNFKIKSPKDKAKVSQHFKMTGTWSPRKGEKDPHVVIIDEFTDDRRFLFKDAVQLTRRGTWHTENRFSPIDSNIFVHIAVLGPNSQILARYYHHAGDTSKEWVAVDELPDDAVKCDSIFVQVRSKTVSKRKRQRKP